MARCKSNYHWPLSPQGYALCGQRLSAATKLPCRHCKVTTADIMNPDYEESNTIAGHRTAAWNEAMRHEAAQKVADMSEVQEIQAAIDFASSHNQPIANLNKKLESKKKNALEELLKAQSLHQATPAFLTAPMGAHSGGINDATPPDMLHQMSLGLFKRAFRKILEMVKSVTAAAGAGAGSGSRRAAAAGRHGRGGGWSTVATGAGAAIRARRASIIVHAQRAVAPSTGTQSAEVVRRHLIEAANAAAQEGGSLKSGQRLAKLDRRLAAFNTRHNGK